MYAFPVELQDEVCFLFQILNMAQTDMTQTVRRNRCHHYGYVHRCRTFRTTNGYRQEQPCQFGCPCIHHPN